MGADARLALAAKNTFAQWAAANPAIVAAYNATPEGRAMLQSAQTATGAFIPSTLTAMYNAQGGNPQAIAQGLHGNLVQNYPTLFQAPQGVLSGTIQSFAPIAKAAAVVGGVAVGANLLAGATGATAASSGAATTAAPAAVIPTSVAGSALPVVSKVAAAIPGPWQLPAMAVNAVSSAGSALGVVSAAMGTASTASSVTDMQAALSAADTAGTGFNTLDAATQATVAQRYIDTGYNAMQVTNAANADALQVLSQASGTALTGMQAANIAATGMTPAMYSQMAANDPAALSQIQQVADAQSAFLNAPANAGKTVTDFMQQGQSGGLGDTIKSLLSSPVVATALSAGATAIGTYYKQQAATQSATALAAGQTQAATILSTGAQQAAQMQSAAALGAANTLATAKTQAANTYATGITAGAGTLAAGYQQAAAQKMAGEQSVIDTARQTLATQTQYQQPYMDAGTQALKQLSAGLQPGGQFNQPFKMQDTEAYRFAREQAATKVSNVAAMGGTQLSSQNLQDIAGTVSNIAAQQETTAFNQWMAQNNLTLGGLQSLIQTGQISTQQLSQALTNAGTTIEAAQRAMASAQAAGTLGAAQATSDAQAAAARAISEGQVGAGQATAQGQIGSAQALAQGVTGSSAAQAGGIVGSSGAQAAGTTSAANIIGSGITSVGQQLAGGITPQPMAYAQPNITIQQPMARAV